MQIFAAADSDMMSGRTMKMHPRHRNTQYYLRYDSKGLLVEYVEPLCTVTV